MIAFQSRKYCPKQTTSHFSLFDEDEMIFDCKILEPEWKRNKKNISCIPEGWYDVVPHVSPQYGNCLLIKNAPNRSLILFHWGNFRTNTEGCLLTGNNFKDINGDGLKDVTISKKTFDKLMKIAPNGFRLRIFSENPVAD